MCTMTKESLKVLFLQTLAEHHLVPHDSDHVMIRPTCMLADVPGSQKWQIIACKAIMTLHHSVIDQLLEPE